MTLVWLAAILAFIVAAAVYAVWLVQVNFRKTDRIVWLNGQRIRADILADGDDRYSRRAWAAHRHTEYQRAMTISLQRANDDAFDRLTDLFAQPAKLEVGRVRVVLWVVAVDLLAWLLIYELARSLV